MLQNNQAKIICLELCSYSLFMPWFQIAVGDGNGIGVGGAAAGVHGGGGGGGNHAANFMVPPQPSPSEPYPAVQLPPEPGDND